MRWQTWMAIILLLVAIGTTAGFFVFKMPDDSKQKVQYIMAASSISSLFVLSLILFISYQIMVSDFEEEVATATNKLRQAFKVKENAYKTIVSS
jgi:hypothetical protein